MEKMIKTAIVCVFLIIYFNTLVIVRCANTILFVLRYIMRVQIYFRMRKVKATRDITSLSH